MRANSFSRCWKKLTTLSISSRPAPAVEAMRGLSVFTIRSRSGQSVNEQLAILMMPKPISSIRSTDGSSKGVHMERKPCDSTASFSRWNCSRDSCGFTEAFDIFHIHSRLVTGMDERVQVPELELEGEPEGELARDVRKGLDHGQPMIHAAHMVVRHFENEQRFVKPVLHVIFLCGPSGGSHSRVSGPPCSRASLLTDPGKPRSRKSSS